MKSSLPLQEEQIITAIEALVNDGQKLTYKTIRDHIGRGSNSQIGPAYRKWQRENRPALNVDHVPLELVDSAKEMLSHLWQSASAMQQCLLAEERHAIQAQALINETAIERIEAENNLLCEQLVSESDRNQQLQTSLADQQSKSRDHEEKIHELRLTGQHQQDTIARNKDEIASLNEQLIAANALAVSHQNDANKLKIEVTKLTSTNDVIKNIASEASAVSLAQASEISRLSSELKISTETSLRAQEQCEILTVKVTDIENALHSSQRDNHALEQSDKHKDEQINELKKAVFDLKNDIKIASKLANETRSELQDKLDLERENRLNAEAKLNAMMSLETLIKNNKERQNEND